MKYIDKLENFKTGKYRGEGVFDVAEEDPGYLQYLLEDGQFIDADDRALIRAALELPEEE
jgi:hypothetical protein